MARKHAAFARHSAVRKFRNEPTYVDGFRFDSKKEARRYGELRLLERAGSISRLECHPTLTVEINGRHYLKFTPDFSYLDHRNGRAQKVVEDVKSPVTRKLADYRLRKKAVELAHGITVVEV